VRWLLDTNVISETVKRQPSRKVIDWIAQRPPTQITISIVTVAELQVGVRSTTPAGRRAELTRWVERELAGSFADRTLPLTVDILIDWIEIGRRAAAAGLTRAPADLLIAATARVHGLIVVSRNVRDFAGTGVVVYDPWHDRMHHRDPA
jgi:predicted nucleic acid-binding protein